MPYCPCCKYEYEDSVTVCPDCDCPLVAKVHEPDHDPVLEAGEVVFRASDPGAAMSVQALLESQGIPTALAASMPDLVPATRWFLGDMAVPATYRGEILVPAEDADRARELLRSFEEQSKE